MAQRTLTAVIQNVGSNTVTVYVGATIVLNSIGGSGCSLNAAGNPHTDLQVYQVTLSGGQQTTIQWTFDDSYIGGVETTPGQVAYAIVKVWESYSNGQLSNCLAGAYAQFTVEGPEIQIVSVTVQWTRKT